MEKISKESNENHKEILNIASKLYNKTSKTLNESYYIGKKESYEEILNWVLKNCKNERYINPNIFNNILIEKIAKAKIALKEEDDIENLVLNEKKEKKKFHNKNCYNISNKNNQINNNEYNIFPTSVASIFNNNRNSFHFSNNLNQNNNSEDDISMSNSSPIPYSPNQYCLKRKKN